MYPPKKYVDAAIPQILSAWSKEALLSRASTEFRLAATDEKLVALFQKITLLGPFQKYEGSSGRVNISWSTQNGKRVIARYIATARFDRGDARIEIQLIQREGKWQIMSFFIE